MAKGSDYRIKKLEKGPLQRFKNQNLIIKKFGEVGLQIYKAITGKRTTSELQKDLGIEPNLFDQILTYMQDAGMVELEPTTSSSKKQSEETSEKPISKSDVASVSEEVTVPSEDVSSEKEFSQEKQSPTEPAPEKSKSKKKSKDQITFEEIKPLEFGEEPEQEIPSDKKTPKTKKSDEGITDEIETIGEEPEPESESVPSEGSYPNADEESTSEKPIEPSKGDETISEDLGLSLEDQDRGDQEQTELSPVEKIISDKYGDIGLQVYSLIDGQRTAEEIMHETGLTEPKLVEILDFMDEQGIIKLDYPKGGSSGAGRAPPPASSPFGPRQQAAPPPPSTAKKGDVGFVPMIEGDESLDEARAVPSPIEAPIRAPIDIVKSVQLKAKLMLKFSNNKGTRVFEQVDGKNDILDISIKLDIPLYEVADILRFMLENGMVIMKPMSRADVRKKYGDDGYAVYKRFGKEGLMLYELIGKELTIKQMADKITIDKSKIIDMFIFIHKVLGIELPIDRDVLQKQLGV